MTERRFRDRTPAEGVRRRSSPGGKASGDRPGQWRTFVAVPLPSETLGALRALSDKMPRVARDSVRWIDADGIHLTLRFLGGIEPDRVPQISESLLGAAAQSGRFALRLGGLGAFPSLDRPRVFWVGLDGELDRLKRLHARVEGALSRVGVEPEARDFEPHLTVGRMRNGIAQHLARRAGYAFARAKLPMPALEFTVASITLFRSHLSDTGARYEALSEAPLG